MSFRQPFRPLWRPQERVFGDRRPGPRVRRWLLDGESLTRRLQERWGTEFSVQLIGQAWRPPVLEESRLLGLRPGLNALIREVRLCDRGCALVRARTVMPGTTLTGPLRRLGALGTRPLGAAIFAYPALERRRLDVACLAPGDPLFPGLETPAWGRRSLFSLKGRELLVYEVFLPEFFDAPARLMPAAARAA